MCTHPPPISSRRWHEAAGAPVPPVPAWPFRAYLLHVAETLDLPWRAVALSAGLDARTASTIITSRPGGGLVTSSQAAAVVALDAHRLRWRGEHGVDAQHARLMVGALRGVGFSLPTVAEFVRLSRPETAALLDGSMTRCTHRTELLASAALQALGVPCPATTPGTATRRRRLRAVA